MFKFTGILLLSSYNDRKREDSNMTKFYAIVLLSLLLGSNPALAGDDPFELEDDDLFSGDGASDLNVGQNLPTVASSFLNNQIPESAAKNIKKAEKVFCYTVEYAPAGYEGYTISDKTLAVKGFCGELSQTGRELIKKSVLDNNSLYSNSKDDCSVSPKIVLRYVYGTDYTDVLFSSPCHSLTFFHIGDVITTVNAAPGAAIIDQIVKAYEGLVEPYQSPALLGQMVGNGQALNQRDKEVLRRAAPTEAPLKKWNTPQPAENTQPSNKQPAKSGWNKLR